MRSSVTVSRDEMLRIRDDRDFMWLLKSKGVPVLGFCAPRLDPAFEYKRFECAKTGQTIIEWSDETTFTA